jgi:hypothetical protein
MMTYIDIHSMKLYFIILYGLIGCSCLYLAATVGRPRNTPSIRWVRVIALALAAGAAFAILAKFAPENGGNIVLLSAIAVGVLVLAILTWASSAPRAAFTTILAGSAALILTLSLVWWPIESPPLVVAPFAAVLAALYLGLSKTGNGTHSAQRIIMAVFFLAGLLLTLNLAPYQDATALLPLMHHWGAFIGPALHVKAGLVPFYDVPLQYGLGPALAIAATCGKTQCWPGAQIIFLTMTNVMAMLLLAMALTTQRERSWVWLSAVAVTMFCAIYLWPGFPAFGSILMATPSVSGIRFLPVILVAFLLFFNHPRLAAAALVPAMAWSVESAVMSAIVFGLAQTARSGFLKAALQTAGIGIATLVGLVLLHRLVFGVWIDPRAYVEYLIHVPGPLPVDPFSNVLLLVATLLLGLWLILAKPFQPETTQQNIVVTALLFAAATYFLGRSHPNNICNLMPFLSLVAVRALDRSDAAPSVLGKAAAFGLAASVAALVMSPWKTSPFDPRYVLDINAIKKSSSTLQPDVETIRRQIPNPNGLGIADFGPAYVRHPSETLVWTPLDPSSLWSFVPSERRQLYIRRSAAKLRRAGWAIIAPNQLFLLDDLRTSYLVSHEHSVKGARDASGGEPTYVVACLQPKPDIAPELLGPACPI